MLRPRHVFVVFGLCLVVVTVPMAWISATALRLEAADAESRRQAALEENIRLALWRMDSSLASILALENGRPYSAYQAFYPVDRAYSESLNEFGFGEVLVPSPLLTDVSKYVLLHFQYDSKGGITSPQVPNPRVRAAALARYTTADRVATAVRRLRELGRRLDRGAVAVALGRMEMEPAEQSEGAAATANPVQTSLSRSSDSRGSIERQARSRNMQVIAQSQSPMNRLVPLPLEMRGTVLAPIWSGDALLLARRVSVAGSLRVQGCWLDWPAMKTAMLSEIADLLPAADLQPLASDESDDAARVLAALPVRLVPGQLPPGRGDAWSPIGVTLMLAWAAMLLAVVAVAALLFGTVTLSERRAAFVSAVTHELRTPLTTLRLYTELLDEGRVADEAKRRRYIHTLRGEADRLTHLVENVLSYARLERGNAVSNAEPVRVRNLLDRVSERFANRAVEARMTWKMQIDPDAADALLRVDAAAVERILVNLVENACKYAATAKDKGITLHVSADARSVVLRVRDRGPGIAPAEARRLFRPFHRSARKPANASAGVGLGLALSRRLARNMGGDLRLDASADAGACFVLTLPTV